MSANGVQGESRDGVSGRAVNEAPGKAVNEVPGRAVNEVPGRAVNEVPGRAVNGVSGRAGIVHLVGAGPGDPGLLTVRALELIRVADVILYDRLIPAGALRGAREDAELLFVGKEGGGPSMPQEEIEELILSRAKLGLSVVRLKGGDPFVFGRGGEEALRLKEAGIPYEVVPGVTAGIAAPAHAGIPVTHRGLATAVAFVTGHMREDGEQGDREQRGEGDREQRGEGDREQRGEGDREQRGEGDREQRGEGEDERGGGGSGGMDWDALAAFPGTLVFYMGVRRLGEIATSLIAAGRPGSQPAALIERGTTPQQRVLCGRLDTIAKDAKAEGIKAPSITIVGDVARLASDLEWRGVAPLSGLTVAVTRARPQASALAKRLSELGAKVIEAPVIEMEPLKPEIPDLSRYDLLCLTSQNGVKALFSRLSESGQDARALASLTIAAIGPGTERALAERGIRADVVPARSIAEGLIEALEDIPIKRALIATAEEARRTLPDALQAKGAEVDVLRLYRTVRSPLSRETLRRAQEADYITFTSSSTVTFFLEAAKAGGERGAAIPLSPKTRIVSIGPMTSGTLRERNLAPHIEAERHDIDGLIEALLADAGVKA